MNVELALRIFSVVAVELIKDRSHISLFLCSPIQGMKMARAPALLYLDLTCERLCIFIYINCSSDLYNPRCSKAHRGTCTPPQPLIQAAPAEPSVLHVE